MANLSAPMTLTTHTRAHVAGEKVARDGSRITHDVVKYEGNLARKRIFLFRSIHLYPLVKEGQGEAKQRIYTHPVVYFDFLDASNFPIRESDDRAAFPLPSTDS